VRAAIDSSDGAVTRRGRLALAGLGIALAVAVAAPRAGAAGGGGIAPPKVPEVKDVRCLTKCIKPRKGVIGSKVRIIGIELNKARVVSLPRADGRRAKDFRPRVWRDGSVIAFVKKGAVTGAVKVFTSESLTTSSPSPFKVGTWRQLRRVQKRYRFPVRGPHSYGDGLGAGRGHEGQDIFARCGTRIVAAHTGRVIYRGFQGAAGNYVSIYDRRTNRTHQYLHLIRPSPLVRGQQVSTGQLVGRVGQTGRATGCHLHFELRRGIGWRSRVLNPTPSLKYWDSYS
jgi:murein DD-endopeptidase MepM/ murein hydrolase activator NlpD